jgi:hypothetical protein
MGWIKPQRGRLTDSDRYRRMTPLYLLIAESMVNALRRMLACCCAKINWEEFGRSSRR